MEDIIDKPDNTLKDEGEKIKDISALKAMRKEVQAYTQSALNENKSRNTVLDEMLDKFGTANEKLLAQDIAWTISFDDKKQNKIWFFGLLALELILVAFFLYLSFQKFTTGDSSVLFYVSTAILSLIHFGIITSLIKASGKYLNMLIIFGFLNLLEFKGITVSGMGIASYLYFASSILSIGIAFYLRRKLFQHIGFFGLKRNEAGKYIL